MEFDLSIIIVNWNTREQTLACIKSIIRYRDDQARVQVIVVDNASDDGSQDALREISDSVELIENQENLGFGRANNVGLKRATGRIVLFLNSDTEITEDFIPNLLKEFDLHPDIAAFGCKILGYDDVPQYSVRGFPSLTAYLYSDTLIGALGLFKASYERYRRKDFNFNEWQRVDMVMGAALSVRNNVLNEVGGFDPQFFMYYEEVDLCRRIRDAGYPIAFSPVPFIYHVGGASSKKDKARMMLVMRQSLLKYFRKHKPAWVVSIFQILFKPLYLINILISYLNLATKAKLAVGPKSIERAEKYKRRKRVMGEFLSRYAMRFLAS